MVVKTQSRVVEGKPATLGMQNQSSIRLKNRKSERQTDGGKLTGGRGNKMNAGVQLWMKLLLETKNI